MSSIIRGDDNFDSANVPLPIQGARAWLTHTGTGTIAIQDSYKITSIVDNGTGQYTVNLDVTFANTNYVAMATGVYTPSSEGWAGGSRAASKTTTSSRFDWKQAGVGSADINVANVAFFGNLA